MASTKKRWSQHVSETSDALDLTKGVFAQSDPKRIARSLKRSAEHSDHRKSDSYRSAMSMRTFSINRAGHTLGDARKGKLARAKDELRAYVKKGFEVFDHIKFTVLDVLRGVDSIAIHYKGITGTHVVEVLFFDKDGAVRESYVHYASPD